MKLTKRKGFNFFRSYYDVYNMLPDNDKIAFMDALLDRQFLGIKPKELKGMANFAYVSQTNSIDSQVKGYEDKTKTKLNPLEDNSYTPTDGGKNTPTEQVEEKEKVQEEVKEKEQLTTTTKEIKNIDVVYTVVEFIKDWNIQRKKHLDKPSFLNRLGNDELINFNDLAKDYKGDDFNYALIGLFKQKKLPNGNTSMQSNPKHFLTHFNSYLTAYHDKNNSLYGKETNHAQTL